MWNTGAWEFIPVLIFALTTLPSKNAKFCIPRKFPALRCFPRMFCGILQQSADTKDEDVTYVLYTWEHYMYMYLPSIPAAGVWFSRHSIQASALLWWIMRGTERPGGSSARVSSVGQFSRELENAWDGTSSEHNINNVSRKQERASGSLVGQWKASGAKLDVPCQSSMNM